MDRFYRIRGVQLWFRAPAFPNYAADHRWVPVHRFPVFPVPALGGDDLRVLLAPLLP